MSLARMASVDYLVDHVAGGDGRAGDAGASPLTRYYTAEGYPPGTWLGSGLAALGAKHMVGSEVTEEQLRELFEQSRSPAAPVRTALPQPAAEDLRGSPVTNRRSLTLAMGMSMKAGGMAFTIDGHPFDATRIDQTVQTGAVEECTITNTSPMDHPFHLHVWPMQVLSVGGAVTDRPTWQNVVNVPANSNSVTRIAFEKDTGRTVYHCHILDHEDNGMMGVVQVGSA